MLDREATIVLNMIPGIGHVRYTALKEAFDAKQLDFALRLFVLNHPQSGVPTECEAWAKQATKEQVLEEVSEDSVLTQFMCR